MDWGTMLLGIEVWIWLMFALGIAAISWLSPKMLGLNKDQAVKVTAVGIVSALILVAVASGVSFGAEEPATVTGVGSEYSITVTSSASQTWVTKSGDLFTCNGNFNDTSDASVGSTQYFQCNISALRTAGTGDSKLQIEVEEPVGQSPYNGSSPKERYDIIDIGTDDEYEADFTASDGTGSIMEAVMAFDSDDTRDFCTLNITWSDTAIQYMDRNDQASITINVIDPAIGTIYSFDVQLIKTTTTGG